MVSPFKVFVCHYFTRVNVRVHHVAYNFYEVRISCGKKIYIYIYEVIYSQILEIHIYILIKVCICTFIFFYLS